MADYGLRKTENEEGEEREDLEGLAGEFHVGVVSLDSLNGIVDLRLGK